MEGTLIGHVTGRLAARAAGRGRRPRLRVVAAVLLAALLAFGAATARLFVWPAQGMPAHVSAIVMLAGPGDRLHKALQLASARRARMLVVSRGHLGYGSVCPPDPPGLMLICFEPVPASTRGESEFIGHLATRYHWRSIVLVTSRPQDTRARIRVGRCFAGQIYVVAVQQPWYDWPYQIAYEWAAMFKAVIIQRAC